MIFFDDQDVHLKESSKFVPSGRVPYAYDSPLFMPDLTNAKLEIIDRPESTGK